MEEQEEKINPILIVDVQPDYPSQVMSGKTTVMLVHPAMIIAAHLADIHSVVPILTEPEPFPIRSNREFDIEPFDIETLRIVKENKPADWKYRKGKQYKNKFNGRKR